jgi:hypothetical protein
MLPSRGSLYAEEYSITKLRSIAEDFDPSYPDNHHDLWEGLKVTFKIISQGCEELKVFGYNGELFDNSKLLLLNRLSIKNYDLLAAVKNLCIIQEENVQKRINYLDLGVEEIGAIYESLLQYVPRISDKRLTIRDEQIPAKRFFLDPRGFLQKTSGSYYTDHRLIEALICSTLSPVLERKLKDTVDTKQKSLLRLRVCDPSCGSGAFLIAATNYLAKELARLKSGDIEPEDTEIRMARREVLQHCIYGVDKNPMAVELTKVSLWINAAVENMPLNFLDHHIKCGDSVIGISKKMLENEIPDSAFNPIQNDDKMYAKKIRLLNKKAREQTTFSEYIPHDDTKHQLSSKYEIMTNLK